VFKSLKPAF